MFFFFEQGLLGVRVKGEAVSWAGKKGGIAKPSSRVLMLLEIAGGYETFQVHMGGLNL